MRDLYGYVLMEADIKINGPYLQRTMSDIKLTGPNLLHIVRNKVHWSDLQYHCETKATGPYL